MRARGRVLSRPVKRTLAALGILVATACGAPSPTPMATTPPADAGAGAPVRPSAPSVSASGEATAVGRPSGATPTAPSVEEIWRRVAPDLTACYETGRRAVPEMVDGRIAFVAAIEASGKTSCVVPNDDSGLTQEVEDCMRTRLERESYVATPAAWSTRVPVQVKAGQVGLGGPNMQTSIDTIESRGLEADIYTVLDGLLPDVKECIRGSGKSVGRRVVVVGARVAKDGGVACAVASSTSPVSEEARGCLTGVFSRARFQAPKRGTGLLSVPIEIMK